MEGGGRAGEGFGGRGKGGRGAGEWRAFRTINTPIKTCGLPADCLTFSSTHRVAFPALFVPTIAIFHTLLHKTSPPTTGQISALTFKTRKCATFAFPTLTVSTNGLIPSRLGTFDGAGGIIIAWSGPMIRTCC